MNIKLQSPFQANPFPMITTPKSLTLVEPSLQLSWVALLTPSKGNALDAIVTGNAFVTIAMGCALDTCH